MRNTLLVSTATAALLLIAPTSEAQTQPPAAQQPQQGAQAQPPSARGPGAATQAQTEASKPFTRVQIRTAADLTGRPLLDAASGVVGEIEYLLIDAGSAKVRYAIVGRGGVLDLGEELVAVPWSHIRMNDGMPPRIDAYMEDLEGAPRLTWSTLGELTEPNFVTQVTNYFAPIMGRQAGAGQPRIEDRSGGSQAGTQFQGQAGPMVPGSGAQQMPQAGPQRSGSGPHARGTQDGQGGAQQGQGQAGRMTPDGMQTMLSDQSIGSPGQQRGAGQQMPRQSGRAQPTGGGQQQSGPGSGQEAQEGSRQDAQSTNPSGTWAQQPRQAEAPAGQWREQQAQAERQRQAQLSQGQQEPTGFILVGRSIVTTLGPPAFKFASGLRGAEVVAQDGSEIGEVAQLMIDVERGRVAYVTIAQGGFLGLGETFKPVPLQALDWAGPETFRLQVPRTALDRMPELTGDVPTMVRRSDLERLYQQFGLTPYWQQT